jgi:hypothetical protein
MRARSDDRETILSQRQRSQRTVQATLGLLSLGSLLIGLAIYLMSARLGLPAETARVLATAFLIAAICDALVLYLWERIFPPADGP